MDQCIVFENKFDDYQNQQKIADPRLVRLWSQLANENFQNKKVSRDKNISSMFAANDSGIIISPVNEHYNYFE